MTRETLTIPARMAGLPRNKAGYVVPWFVGWVDGQPDFRVARADGIGEALRYERCWLCGQHRGRFAAFVIGPMCAVNRVSAEPPSHRDCATYAAQACPFLANPNMQRRDRHKPAHTKPAGNMIARNPGVALVWTTRTWSTFPAPGGVLFDIGDPVAAEWYANGSPATRAEVLASIDSGLPILAESARDEGPEATAELDRMLAAAMAHVPAA
jgi:hypothetical protein